MSRRWNLTLIVILTVVFFPSESTQEEARKRGEPTRHAPRFPNPPLHLLEDVIAMAETFECTPVCKKRIRPGLVPPQNISDRGFKFYPCYCDEGCHVFGDCCADVVLSNSSQSDQSQRLANHSTSLEEHSTGDDTQPTIRVKEFMGIPVDRWGCHALNIDSNGTEVLNRSHKRLTRCPYWFFPNAGKHADAALLRVQVSHRRGFSTI